MIKANSSKLFLCFTLFWMALSFVAQTNIAYAIKLSREAYGKMSVFLMGRYSTNNSYNAREKQKNISGHIGIEFDVFRNIKGGIAPFVGFSTHYGIPIEKQKESGFEFNQFLNVNFRTGLSFNAGGVRINPYGFAGFNVAEARKTITELLTTEAKKVTFPIPNEDPHVLAFLGNYAADNIPSPELQEVRTKIIDKAKEGYRLWQVEHSKERIKQIIKDYNQVCRKCKPDTEDIITLVIGSSGVSYFDLGGIEFYISGNFKVPNYDKFIYEYSASELEKTPKDNYYGVYTYGRVYRQKVIDTGAAASNPVTAEEFLEQFERDFIDKVKQRIGEENYSEDYRINTSSAHVYVHIPDNAYLPNDWEWNMSGVELVADRANPTGNFPTLSGVKADFFKDTEFMTVEDFNKLFLSYYSYKKQEQIEIVQEPAKEIENVRQLKETKIGLNLGAGIDLVFKEGFSFGVEYQYSDLKVFGAKLKSHSIGVKFGVEFL